MQLLIARTLFVCVIFLFHRVIAKRMHASFGYFMQTMDLIDQLYSGVDNYRWKTRVFNLMESYSKEFRYV